jgi:hypothetical protein
MEASKVVGQISDCWVLTRETKRKCHTAKFSNNPSQELGFVRRSAYPLRCLGFQSTIQARQRLFRVGLPVY